MRGRHWHQSLAAGQLPQDLVKLGLISEHAEQRKTTVYRLHLDRIARGLLTQAAPLAEQLQKYEPLPELPASIQELTQQRMA